MSRIDLHGMTVHTAWKKYRSITQDCYYKQVKKITVITGHGQMKKNTNKQKEPEPVDLTGLYKKFNR
jgi:DNA-nicking Smr family endonuclease